MKFHFRRLLQNSGWLSDVAVSTDAAGIIGSIEDNAPKNDCDEISDGCALPGFQNAHSHSFQYAMAGLAENHSGENQADNFWSWRNAMYKIALSVNPDQLEAIAALAYAEMLRHGYTNVAEFHYLHNDISGVPYINRGEMGARLISAAKRTGINITLVPIFYQMGGFGKPPEKTQRRFISKTKEEYAELFDASAKACENYEGANIGVGIHSLRAVEAADIKEVVLNFAQDMPFHIHIAEQKQEISDSIVFLGKRPVEWMLENLQLSERFHFVHATHVNDDEIYGLADMKVNVVLCPTTEGNLGDGIFPLGDFQERSGAWSIGTDSHISLSPFEEIRLLDYGQRLTTNNRNTFGERSGAFAIDQALITGRKAMNNFEKEYFKIGAPLNACIISSAHPLIQTSTDESLLNTMIYSLDETSQEGTIVNGQWRSRNGRHEQQDEFSADFIRVMRELDFR